MTQTTNPIVYVEIPVCDIDRAMTFYGAVFGFEFGTTIIDGNEMALLPFNEKRAGISGDLAKGEINKPTHDGVLVYFATHDIAATLHRATTCGGRVLYPVTDNGMGLVAEFEDTEGSRIALYQQK